MSSPHRWWFLNSRLNIVDADFCTETNTTKVSFKCSAEGLMMVFISSLGNILEPEQRSMGFLQPKYFHADFPEGNAMQSHVEF